MKFPSLDETKMPTEAAEENVVEIEALGTATLRRDYRRRRNGSKQETGPQKQEQVEGA
jgi:hypothetical protein